ncbi:MAG TPA: YihY/virulence factor BrkB family protein [Bradyrhizobium sp.]
MSKQPSILASDLALVVGTVLATLAVHRHISTNSRHALAGPHGPADSSEANAHVVAAPAAGPLTTFSRRWKDVLSGTYQRIDRDRILATAAGVVFYGLLAIFPAVTALVSSYGLFADPSTIVDNLQTLALMLPDGSFAIVQDEIGRVLAKHDSALGMTFIFGLLLAVWSANAGMKAIIDALNVAYETEERRSWIRLNLISIAFTVAALAAILVMVAAVILVPLLITRLGLDHRAELLVQVLRWPALAVVLLAALFVLYRYGASRSPPGWRWLGIGAVVAAALWLIGSSLLSWYLSNFANYTATYGSLGAAIGLMTWMWMSAIIILVGAELNSEIECEGRVATG